MKKESLVSVIIPTYNRAHLIGETLDSVLAQTYQNWECIIVDDGSSDDTDEVVGEYVKKDSRFKYFHRPDEHLPGGNGARNYGFKMSQGEFVNWFDSDDLFSENKLEEQIKLLLGKTYSVSTCKWGRFKNEERYPLKKLEIYKNYNSGKNLLIDYGIKGNYFPSFSFLCTRDIFLKSGLWNEHLRINQDGEFFCRVLINTDKVYCAKNAFGLYRFEDDSNTSNYSSEIKAKHAIISWKLIESHLSLVDGDYNDYTERIKYFLYHRLKNNYKNVIFNNPIFFKKQIKYFSLRGKIKRKLRHILSKSNSKHNNYYNNYS